MIASCGIPEPFSSTNYYVSPSGDNSNDGLSEGGAFQTISGFLGGVTLSPGVTLNLEGGAVFRERIEVADRTGTSQHPIRIQSYGTGQADIRASDVAVSWTLVTGTTYSSTDISTDPFAVVDATDEKSPQYQSSQADVENNVDSWWWNSGTLYLNIGEDPTSHQIECVVRDDAIEIDESSHVIISNVKTSFTGTDAGGYGVRVSPRSSHVTIADVSCTWGGKHHFAFLSADNCYGLRLTCSKWTQGKGDSLSVSGSTALVSYAASGNPASTTGWRDCVSSDLTNGLGGRANGFVAHGDGLERCDVIGCTFDTSVYVIPQNRTGVVNFSKCRFEGDSVLTTTPDGTDPTIAQEITLDKSTFVGPSAGTNINIGNVTETNSTVIA